MKLLSIVRSIEIYQRDGEEFVSEIPFDLPAETLKSITMPKEGDDTFYLPYELNLEQLNKLLDLIEASVEPDINSFCYYLSCTGIYDRSKS